MTMCAVDPAHPRDVGQWGVLWRTRRREADDSLAVGPRAGDALAGVLTDEEAVARAADVLPAGGGVADGRGLGAVGTLDHVLIAFARYVDSVLKIKGGHKPTNVYYVYVYLTNPARDHWSPSAY